ncbi:MAG: VacJ family lipoprotein [Kiloniellales bacterium]
MATLFSVILLVGCATAPEPGDIQYAQGDGAVAAIDADIDPLEGVNRFIFAFNDMLDTVVFQPLAATYRFLLPDGVRDSVRNFLRNLNTPVILANDVMQGDMRRAEETLARFMLNTIIGVGGLFDVAAASGYDYHDEDFGQTLGVYGVGGYPYLVLPVFGPSTARDTVGMLVDSFLDPLGYVVDDEIQFGRRLVAGVDFRARNIENIEELKRDSIDYYARIRSIYLQMRVDAINNGERPDFYPAPGLSWDGLDDDQVTTSE